MASQPPDQPATPSYRPAPYLISGPSAFLTSDELMRYFEDFYASLGYVNTAPQMVFERLIGNLSVPVNAAIERARRASGSEACAAGIRSLEVRTPAVPYPTAVAPSITAPAIPPVTIADPVILPPIIVDKEVRNTTSHIVRSFSVEDCAEWDASSAFEYTKAFLTTGQVHLSRFAIALTSFNLANSAQLIASASVTTPEDTGFSVTLSNVGHPGYSSRLKSASCNWLELGDQAPDMQCGVWSLPDSHGSNQPEEYIITFPMRYNRTPRVRVWMRGLHMSPSLDRSLKLDVREITAVGFTLRVTCRSSAIRSLEISWFACPDWRLGVESGTFSTGDNNSADGNLLTKFEGYVAFHQGGFTAPPRIAVGMTAFEIAKEYHLCLSVQVLEVTCDGMKWRIDGGEHGKITSASASFIALE